MENNNVGYSVNGGNAPRKVSREEKLFGTFSLICGITTIELLYIKQFINYGLSHNELSIKIEPGEWTLPFLIVLTAIGTTGIVLGAIALVKNRQFAIGKAGFIISIIGVAIIGMPIIFVELVPLLLELFL